MNTTIKKAIESIETEKARSAWARGVNEFAVDLLHELNGAIEDGYFDADDVKSGLLIDRAFLNGASDWKQYAWGGSGLIYDFDIARALCNPSELKKTDGGRKRPNRSEEWLDVYARAMFQAASKAKRALLNA